MPTSSRRVLQTAASAIAFLDLVAGIFLFIHISDRTHDRSDARCEKVHELIDYSRSMTSAINDPFIAGTPTPTVEAYQQWADRMQQYADQLAKSYPTDAYKYKAHRLAHGSREIVLLFQYAQTDTAPVSDENPPPLWIKRYNDIGEEFELWFTDFGLICPT